MTWIESLCCVGKLIDCSPSALKIPFKHSLLANFPLGSVPKPACSQLYNIFYASDPAAVRMEPLIQDKFKFIAPMKVPRYQKFPLGDGQSIHVGEYLC